MLAPLLEMKGITKRFPSVLANSNVSISLQQGEILALVGENGAGKSTLMNILYGLYQPDQGEIWYRGNRVEIEDPMNAIALGIGMVHQHFMLIPSFTVYENVILGAEPTHGMRLNRRRAIEDVQDLAKKNGFNIDPMTRVRNLDVGTQQRVEILKALYRGAELLVLDEPTAVLTPQETQELFGILRGLTAQGKSIIFITHKLEEVMAVSDQVIVMRQGQVTMAKATKETSVREIANSMVGREVLFDISKPPAQPGAPVLEVDDLWAGDDRGLLALKGLEFKVRAGEIVGIAGVAGNGQTELIEVLAGLRETLKGRVSISGQVVTNLRPLAIREKGLAHIPEDRYLHGLAGRVSVEENVIMFRHNHAPFKKGLFIDEKERARFADELMESFDVRPRDKTVPAGSLSGGNAQKMIVGREMLMDKPFLIAAQPTRGIDVGAIEFIHELLIKQRDQGKAILLVSTELEEILTLSDRILVMYEGEIMGEVPGDEATPERLGLLMAGLKEQGGEPHAG